MITILYHSLIIKNTTFFRHKDGSHIHPMWFYNKLQRILKRTNINKKIRWHDLRHSSATHYIQNNADVVFVSHLLGHLTYGQLITI